MLVRLVKNAKSSSNCSSFNWLYSASLATKRNSFILDGAISGQCAATTQSGLRRPSPDGHGTVVFEEIQLESNRRSLLPHPRSLSFQAFYRIRLVGVFVACVTVFLDSWRALIEY